MLGQRDVRLVDKKRRGIATGYRAPPPQEKKKKFIQHVPIDVIRTRQSFQPRHENSKNLFVLNIPRERMVSYEVVHWDERERWFVSVGPRNRPVSWGIRVMVGRWAGWSCFSNDWWARTMGDGRQVI